MSRFKINDDGVLLEYTPLTNEVIPDGVTKISKGAFRDCECLNSVVIGNGVTSIGHLAFWGCDNLKSVEVPEDCKIVKNAFPPECKITFRKRNEKTY